MKLVQEKKKRRIFLDYASTTPVHESVEAAMKPFFSKKFGNPSSLHAYGQEARMAVDEARDIVARFLACRLQEVIFTSGATEANNLALTGAVEGILARSDKQPHIIVSAIEHPSVLECAQDLKRRGKVQSTILAVSRYGFINAEDLKKAIKPNTFFVSVQYANSEIGVIQAIPKLSAVISEERKKRASARNPFPIFFHSDAAQAANFLDCRVDSLGVDYLTLSGHKIYGPKGVGVLYARAEAMLSPMLFGGHQEFGRRSGTENVPAVMGMARAVELINRRASWIRTVRKERDRLVQEIIRVIPDASINGSVKYALPNIANIFIPGVPGESLLIALDQNGIAVSLGSACSTRALKPSHVILALGYSKERARGSIRISLGRFTKRSDIDRLLSVFPSSVETLRTVTQSYD